mgnify:FL=1
MSTIFDEFCRETTAFINPTDCIKPLSEFPEICITTFSQNIITEFIENNNTKIIANLYSANGILPVYEIKYDDAVVNGFLALFLNLIVLPLLVVVSFMLFKGSIQICRFFRRSRPEVLADPSIRNDRCGKFSLSFVFKFCRKCILY